MFAKENFDCINCDNSFAWNHQNVLGFSIFQGFRIIGISLLGINVVFQRNKNWLQKSEVTFIIVGLLVNQF